MYVLPMEKYELEFVTSACTMYCNVLLHDYTRRTRTLFLLTDHEHSREADLRGLASFTEAIIGTRECAVGKRA
jgi:hypothetical protein